MQNLHNRLKFIKIFDTKASIPKTKDECLDWFEKIYCDMSPENLTCDGELSNKKVQIKLNQLQNEWKELEELYGEEMSISDFESKFFEKGMA